MGAQHHVFGPAAVYTSVGQSAGTVALFGISTDGVSIEVINYVDPIHDDRAGPDVSTDEQYFGQEARITADLIWYDETVRQQIFAVAQNNTSVAANEGKENYAGILFGIGTIYYNLVIQSPAGSSPTSETLWNFLNARLLDAEQVKLGTVKNVWRCVWKAVNYLGTAQTLNGSVLYKHVFP